MVEMVAVVSARVHIALPSRARTAGLYASVPVDIDRVARSEYNVLVNILRSADDGLVDCAVELPLCSAITAPRIEILRAARWDGHNYYQPQSQDDERQCDENSCLFELSQ